jgi:hypothetical protein
MPRVVLGNRNAVHSRDHGETREKLPGKQATVIDIDESTSLGSAFQSITSPVKGIWASHSAEGATPAWVASDSPAMAAILAEHFGGIEIRKLADPYDPATAGKKSGGAAAVATSSALLSLQVTLLGLAFLLLRVTPFLKTNAGNDFQAKQMAGGTASATAVAKWVALTANTTAPAATDTTLTAEITTGGGGLIRTVGVYAHTTSAANYTLTTTFTANGSDSLPVTIGKRGVFDAASAGNLVFTTLVLPTATLSASGDVLTLTDTVSL